MCSHHSEVDGQADKHEIHTKVTENKVGQMIMEVKRTQSKKRSTDDVITKIKQEATIEKLTQGQTG